MNRQSRFAPSPERLVPEGSVCVTEPTCLSSHAARSVGGNVHKRRYYFFWGVILTLVTSCGKPSSDFDEAALLQAGGFGNPISMPFQLDQVSTVPAGWSNDQNALVAALLLKTGALAVQPKLSDPWWQFTMNRL